MLGAPGPYAAWASWLDAYGRGEDLPRTHLVPVDDGMGPHMQERLLRRLSTAFDTRAQAWSDALTRHLASGTVTTPAQLAAALHTAKGRLRPLQSLVTDPLLPPDVRTALEESLMHLVRTTQESLERSTRRRGELLAVVRDNSLLRTTRPAPTPTAPPPPVGRRVIL